LDPNPTLRVIHIVARVIFCRLADAEDYNEFFRNTEQDEEGQKF